MSWGVFLRGLGVQKDTQTPCWLRPWLKVISLTCNWRPLCPLSAPPVGPWRRWSPCWRRGNGRFSGSADKHSLPWHPGQRPCSSSYPSDRPGISKGSGQETYIRKLEIFKECMSLSNNKYCKVRNIGVELLLATLASGSDSLILRSVYICSIFQRFFFVFLGSLTIS